MREITIVSGSTGRAFGDAVEYFEAGDTPQVVKGKLNLDYNLGPKALSGIVRSAWEFLRFLHEGEEV